MTNPKKSKLVLAPKVGMEREFKAAVKEAEDIANGVLGFRGQAEMIVDLGLTEMEEWKDVDLPEEIKAKVVAVEEILKTLYFEKILSVSEEVTQEEAVKRRVTTDVLYGKN